MVRTQARVNLTGAALHSQVDLGDSARLALMFTAGGRGTFRAQAQDVLAGVRDILGRQPDPMIVTVLTVFLKDARDQVECEQLFEEFFGGDLPLRNYALQPPSSGAALALEVWAIAGKSVHIERFGPNAMAVTYDGVRWFYCAGLAPTPSLGTVHSQALDVLAQSQAALALAGSSFDRVVRTWFYLGGITEPEAGIQRYQELNRARTEFYRNVRFHCSSLEPDAANGVYPASTGIGMAGRGLVLSCMAFETRRDDVFLLPLENPQQIPAYAYGTSYSPQSPKFSRAVALRIGNYVTTWVSGTASIVDSETRFPGDAARQTEQTIENIERLIAAENFTRHGFKGAGASLHDLAKVRVYLKRREDLAVCQAVCQRRLGAVPVLYLTADICRPDLLVEIEGVAFSRYSCGSSL